MSKHNKTTASKKDQKSIDPNVRQQLERSTTGTQLKRSGLGGTKQVEQIPTYVQAECEKVVKGSTNSWVVLGRDRPQTRLSGEGAGIDSYTSMIDLCVGRGGRDVVSEEEITVNGKNQTSEVKYFNNDFVADAARIYICQKTSIDKNFGLVTGRVGNYNGQLARSAIGLKADNIRIVARHGIKLVTRTDDTYSTGGKNSGEVRGIDIIAGNDDSGLQPMVKGTNLKDLLRFMIADYKQMMGLVHDAMLAQNKFNAVLANHTHTDPLSGLTGPSIETSIAATLKGLRDAIQMYPTQINGLINATTLDIEFLTGENRYILSKNNHVN